MEVRVTFPSVGHQLVGVLHVPDDLRPGERRAAVIVLHGFGDTMEGPGGKNPAPLFRDLGYVAAVRFSRLRSRAKGNVPDHLPRGAWRRASFRSPPSPRSLPESIWAWLSRC